jgi:hypothetical protein
LLLLFNNQVAPDAAQVMPTVQVLLETTTDVMVDISADYKMFTTTRGRNRELDRFQAGTAQVTLLDTSRKYDPSNAAGPYYPNLKPMRSLQLTGTWLGTTYPVFTGFVDSFESEYDGPPSGYAQTTIYATDGFKVLEAADLASSAYAQEVIADSPSHWWRLGDTAAPYLDSVGITHLDVGVGKNAPTPGADGLVSRDTDEALTFLELNTVQLVAPTGSAPTGTVYTVELLIKTPLPPSTTRNIAYWEDAAFNNSQISISGAADAGSLLWEGMSTSPLHPADDSPHHVAVVQTASERLIYVDGTLIISTAGAGSFTGGGKMYLGTSSNPGLGSAVSSTPSHGQGRSASSTPGPAPSSQPTSTCRRWSTPRKRRSPTSGCCSSRPRARSASSAGRGCSTWPSSRRSGMVVAPSSATCRYAPSSPTSSSATT